MHVKALFAVIILAWTLSGCGAAPTARRESIDPETAVTLTTASTPLIFYRDNSAAAAYARDFVYVGPVGVNNMGRYRYFLWFGIWSANPGSLPGAQRDGFDSIILFADGEPMQLELAGWTPAAIGASRNPYLKPVASAADAYYEVTIDQIRLMAGASNLRLLTSGSQAAGFEPWNSQSAAYLALNRFLVDAAY